MPKHHNEEPLLVRQLEYELTATRDGLQSTIENMKTSNKELKASKEELQSFNETLSTVNNQLQDKVGDLDKTHYNIANLLNHANIATLYLDTNLRIRLFTPTIGKLLGLRKGDSGRPISTFESDFTGDELIVDAHEVLDKLIALENTFNTTDGRSYLRRTIPYRTSDNHIDGLVITFTEISERVAAERQSRRLATILHDSNDAITVLDLNGKITDWNIGAERLYGYLEGEALKMTIYDLLPKENQSVMDDILNRSTSGKLIKSFGSLRLTKNGKNINVRVTATPLYDEYGKVTALATTEHDIGEKLELDALHIETDRLVSMVENLPAGAVFRENDHLRVNHAVERITGYDRSELKTIDLWYKNLYGDQSAQVRQQFDLERAAGFSKQTKAIGHKCKNGEIRYVEYAAYSYSDHEIWILHDVTKQHVAEMALRYQEERLRAVMDNAADAIVVIGNNGLVTDFNNGAVKLFGYSAKEVIGQNINLLMPSPYHEEHDSYLKIYSESGERHIISYPRELPGRRQDGSTFPMLLNVSEIESLGAFVGLIHDLSAQKILEKQIADISTEERENFGQEIHDGLCQQLAGLSMIAQSLKQYQVNPDTSEAELVDELILELRRTIEDARILARGLSPVPVTPEGLEDAFDILARDVNEKTETTCTFEGYNLNEVKDRTVAMQIYRIAQEAVKNTIKHAQANNIKISLDGIKGQCDLQIIDDGCGFNIDKKLTETYGIRIMRYRAGIIGGSLQIDSSPGKGTTIHCSPTIIDSEG